MDSVTDEDIDRIYDRVEKDVDMSEIGTKDDLLRAVKSNNKVRSWGTKINEAIFVEVEAAKMERLDKIKKRAKRKKKTQVIDTVKSTRYEVVYRKNGTLQTVARSVFTGRFTKVDRADLLRSLG